MYRSESVEMKPYYYSGAENNNNARAISLFLFVFGENKQTGEEVETVNV